MKNVLICFPFDGGVKQLSDLLFKKALSNYTYVNFSPLDSKMKKLAVLKLLFSKKIVFSSNNVFIYMILPFIYKKAILIHHDHKVREGASNKEKILNMLFVVFRVFFKKVIIHRNDDEVAKKLLKYNNVFYAKMPPHGFNTERSGLINTNELASNISSKTILCFGRVEEYKNFDWFCELVSELPHIDLIIAGKGGLGSEFSDKKRYPNIDIINSYISDSELTELMSKCHYLALPYKDITQTGLIELAGYYCKPVIISNVFSHSADVKNGTFRIDIYNNEKSKDTINSLPIEGEDYDDSCLAMKEHFISAYSEDWKSYTTMFLE
ncbi:glycosyltransferase [Vibrio splendidus]|uniref:glycosyltransferase n=1 Tax=Vibrio splendidus TaxID=29497 RepID=UPI000C82E7F6|nr:glycosyltransferase [Vibrio splendidus]PMI28586.1 hypothetical protein BCU48_15225 [Vibrio splendidus]